MRGGGGRSVLTTSRESSTGRTLTERQPQDTRISTRTGNTVPGVTSGRNGDVSRLSKDLTPGTRTGRINKEGQRIKRPGERKSPSGYFDIRKDRQRINRRNETALRDNKNLSPNERRQSSPYLRNQNDRKSTNGNIRPRTYNSPRREYNSSGRRSFNNYISPNRDNSPRNYSAPQRNSSPRTYSAPRSYSPPQRSSAPPSSGGGGRSGGGSSGGGRR